MRLPIFELETDFLAALREDQARIVVEAPTGSGKSTQIPQFLLKSGLCDSGEIYVLQPRRLAARMLAARVAEERASRLGEEIGYQVRFESAVSRKTRVRFVTEGILIRKLLEQPDLADISAVVLDEFHERHFFGDISLARCLDVQRTLRPDLKVIAMSATLETAPLCAYLGPTTRHLISSGRTYPVEILYSPPRERHRGELWDHAARAIHEHLKDTGVKGNILVFMPGQYEIQKTLDVLRRASWSSAFDLHALHGELPPARQDAAVQSGTKPKIVVATNVAETSITIDGVRLVVDSGLERRSSFDSRRGINTLHIEKISLSSADQRAGRAGRTAPGVAIRLWRESEQRELATPPEIKRMDLTEAVLILCSSGVRTIRDFPWFEAPDPKGLDEAIHRLQELGALDQNESLTPGGHLMGQAPVPPRYARILLEASRRNCLLPIARIVALTQARSLFPLRKRHSDHLMPSDFAQPSDVSDFQPLLRAWQQMETNQFRSELGERLGIHAGAARDVDRISQQLVRIASRWSHPTDSPNPSDLGEPDGETLARILLSGFSDRLALRLSPSTLSCAVIGGRRGILDKESVASEKDAGLFIASEMIEVEGKDVSVKLSLCTRIAEDWLRQLFPQDFHEHNGALWDERQRRVEARRERRFRDLVIESRVSGEPPGEQAALLLAQRVLAGELNLKAWDEKVDLWFARIALVAEHCPDYGLTLIDDESKLLILEQICQGAVTYSQIKDRPVWKALHQWLPPHQVAALDQLAPETIALSNGRTTRVHYRLGEKPRISVLIQHIFGRRDTPTVCDGRVPIVIEILAPNHRPIQVTENLSTFWTGSYPAIRTQLRGRYPKHEWPEF